MPGRINFVKKSQNRCTLMLTYKGPDNKILPVRSVFVFNGK